jgi:hypothetical protein
MGIRLTTKKQRNEGEKQAANLRMGRRSSTALPK